MILSSRSQQQVVLRAANAVLKPCRVAQLSQRRHVGHRVPPLTHGEQFAHKGVPGLLSPGGFDMAWTQYQAYLVTRLNEMTARTPDENSQVKSILLKHARDPGKASLFNHASMAHNNHLFFSTMTPSPVPPSPTLLQRINTSFSSLSSLRATFIATANALFGPGFVWLVRLPPVSYTSRTTSGQLRILTTYLAGSPYPGAHFRLQPVDMNSANTGIGPIATPTSYATQYPGGLNEALQANFAEPAMGNAGMMGNWAKAGKKVGPGGQDLEVLLGVNTWEHVWLRDYGVGGKKDYLERWWDVVDWSIVEERMNEGQGMRSLGSFGKLLGGLQR